MKATAQDRARLEQQITRLVEQFNGMGARKIILFWSQALEWAEHIVWHGRGRRRTLAS